MPSRPVLRLSRLVVLLLSIVTIQTANASWRPAPFPAGDAGIGWTMAPDQTTIYRWEPFQRSDDAGRTFRTMTRPALILTLGVPYYVHPRDPHIVVVIGRPASDLHRDQLAVSRDGGESWEIFDLPWPEFTGRIAGFDHRGSIFVTSSSHYLPRGLWRSDNLGRNWVEIADLSKRTAVLPGIDQTAILAGWSISFDGGRSFRNFEDPQDSSVLLEAATTSPASARHIILPIQDSTADSTTSAIVTNDGFRTWRRLNVPGDFAEIQIHPRRPNWLFVGEDAYPQTGRVGLVHVSKDFGTTWTTIHLGPGSDVRPVSFDPCSDETVYVHFRTRERRAWARLTLDGSVEELDLPSPFARIDDIHPRAPGCGLLTRTGSGLYAVTERGERWTRVGRGLPVPPVAARDLAVPSLHFDRRDPSRVWAPTFGGLAASRDGGRSWSLEPPFRDRPVDRISTWQEDERLLVWAGTLQVSDDGGASYVDTELLGNELLDYKWVPDPFVPGAGLLGHITLQWFRIEEFGARILGPIQFLDGFIVFDPGTPGRVLHVGDSILLSTDGGLSFERLTTDLPISPSDVRGVEVAIDGTWLIWDHDHQFFRSTDLGQTFETFQVIEPDPDESVFVRSVRADLHTAGTLYAWGSFGNLESGYRPFLVRSTDGGSTWSDWSDGLAGGPVFDLAQSPSDPNRFAVAGYRMYWRDEALGDACASSDESLCLRQDRFEVTLSFADGGAERTAKTVVDRTGDSGLFTFFDPDNWELMVKVLDGCGLNQRFWVLAAATTDRAYSVRVLDRATGTERTYHNAPGRRSPAILDTDAFASCDAAPRPAASAATSTPTPTLPTTAALETSPEADTACPDQRLCLADGRYQVAVRWQDFEGETGEADPSPVQSADSGLFTFFDPANWELMVKVLDACAVNGHVWILGAATTNVGYDLVVTDTTTGDERTYSNPVGQVSPAVIDVEAFPCGG